MNTQQRIAFRTFLATLDPERRSALLDTLASFGEDANIAAEVEDRDLTTGETFIITLTSEVESHTISAAHGMTPCEQAVAIIVLTTLQQNCTAEG